MFGIPLLVFVGVTSTDAKPIRQHWELYPPKPQDSVNGTLSLMIKRQTPQKLVIQYENTNVLMI